MKKQRLFTRPVATLRAAAHRGLLRVTRLWKTLIAPHERTVVYSLLAFVTASYAVLFSVYTILLHETFHTQAFDLGIFDQALWLVSQGKVPFVTVRGLHRFADHAEFILYLLAPVYWVWNNVWAILILQSTALALGALPVFFLARTRLANPWMALAFAVAYLLYPATQNVNLDHVHAEAFATPLLLSAFYCAVTGRYRLYALCAFLALLCKEDVTLTLFTIGLYVAFVHHRRIGLATCGVSAAWFLTCLFLVFPHFTPYGFWRFDIGWWGAWKANLWNPSWYATAFFDRENLRYLFHLLGPVGFLPLLAPLMLLMAAPAVILNILSITPYLRSIEYHYTTSITPVMLIAAIYGAERLLSLRSVRLFLPTVRPQRRGSEVVVLALTPRTLSARHLPASAAVLVLGAAVIGNTALSHLPLLSARTEIISAVNRLRSDQTRYIKQAIQFIPPTAPVSADYTLLPHLAHRDKVYNFPNPFFPRSWGVRDENPHDPNQIQFVLVNQSVLYPDEARMMQKLLDTGLFEQTSVSGSVRLLTRVSTIPRDVLSSAALSGTNGLRGSFYTVSHYLTHLPDVSRLLPDFVGLFPRMDFPPTTGNLASVDGINTSLHDHFAAVFTGYLKVAIPGDYVFTVSSDDGFRLSVDGKVIAQFDAIRAMSLTSGGLSLPAGFVPIELDYFENEGTAGLSLSYTPPGGKLPILIPPTALFPALPQGGETHKGEAKK